MSIKVNELPQATSVQGTDVLLVNTERGTEQVSVSQAGEFFGEQLRPDMQRVAKEQVQETDGFEAGNVVISNNQVYPFNSGVATVALNTLRQNLDYVVNAEVVSAFGNVQTVEVYDKQLNGFKIRYDGSATSVTIKYYVTGGMQA